MPSILSAEKASEREVPQLQQRKALLTCGCRKRKEGKQLMAAALGPVIRLVIPQQLHFVAGHVLGRVPSALGAWVRRRSWTILPPRGQVRNVPEYWRPSQCAATTLMDWSSGPP